MRVKNKETKLDAAGMNQKISIMRPGESSQNTSTGAWTKAEPTLLCEVWANVNNLYGQEYWTARQMQQENTLTFKVFYHPALNDLSSTDYIVWNGASYDIQFPDNLEYENSIVKIRAVKRA
jgi:SPP1 family predicted phage head-tail adaptor